MTQTATIQITNNTIPLPADWGTELNGLKASITKIDGVFVITPQRENLTSYTDEEIAAWTKDDALDEDMKRQLQTIFQRA